jgi:hypothetical protein
MNSLDELHELAVVGVNDAAAYSEAGRYIESRLRQPQRSMPPPHWLYHCQLRHDLQVSR